MKVEDIEKIEDDEILECLNCSHRNSARMWKKSDPIGQCPSCNSYAFVRLQIRMAKDYKCPHCGFESVKADE